MAAVRPCPWCGFEGNRSWFCVACGGTLNADDPSPADVDEHCSGAADDPDEIRVVTALFADIVGSTKLGERLAPAEVKIVVGECVDLMTEAVVEYGGSVGAYIGDGIAAFFGVEEVHEDDPVRGALAGLAIITRVRSYAAQLREAWNIDDFDVRVGINLGRAGVGRIGGGRHHTALGDCVNVAARLQAAAEPGTIVIGDELRRQLPAGFAAKRLGALIVKGRAASVPAWELRDGDPFRVRRTAPGPLVGRDAEISELSEIATALRRGRGGILFIVGEAGIGKSRLLVEFRRGMETDGAAWIQGRCQSAGRDGPYAPIADAVRSWLGVDRATPQLAVRLRLRSEMAELGCGNTTGAFIARLLGLTWELSRSPTSERVDEAGLAEGIRGALTELLKALALRRPLVVAWEDVDRADEASAALIADLMELADYVPVLFVATSRQASGPGQALLAVALTKFPHRARQVPLRALSRQASYRVVRDLDAGEALSARQRRQIVERGEGNPLFLEELVKVERESPAGESQTPWRLPAGVESLLHARIHQLPLGARRLLELAAVCGRSFSLKVLEAVSGASVAEDLQPALRAGLLEESLPFPSREYRFRHGLMREVVLSILTDARRRHLHGQVARALERMAGKGIAQRIDDIAFHYGESDDIPAGLAHLADLGERLFASAAVAAAADACDRALVLARAVDDRNAEAALLRRAAEAWARAGHHGRAADRYRSLTECVEGIERSQVLLKAARCELEAGRLDEAQALCELAIEPAGATEVRTRAMHVKAQLAFRRNDYRNLERILEDISRSALPEDVEVECARLQAGYCLEKGDLEGARGWIEDRVERATASGSMEQLLDSRRDLGILEIVSGDVPSACGTLGWVLEHARQLGHFGRVADAGSNLLYALYLHGDLVGALKAARRVDGIESVPLWAATYLTNLGSVEFDAGVLGAAEEHLRRGLEVAEREGYQRHKIAAVCGLATLDAWQGDLERARVLAQGALKAAQSLAGRFDVRIYARRVLAEVALREGSVAEARHHLAAALDETERAEKPARVALWRLMGQVQEAQERGTGSAALERALSDARGMGMQLEEARALVALAGTGPSRETDAKAGAVAIFARCGAKRELQLVSA